MAIIIKVIVVMLFLSLTHSWKKKEVQPTLNPNWPRFIASMLLLLFFVCDMNEGDIFWVLLLLFHYDDRASGVIEWEGVKGKRDQMR